MSGGLHDAAHGDGDGPQPAPAVAHQTGRSADQAGDVPQRLTQRGSRARGESQRISPGDFAAEPLPLGQQKLHSGPICGDAPLTEGQVPAAPDRFRIAREPAPAETRPTGGFPAAMKPDPDRQLVEACQAQDATGLEGPFRDLYEQYKDRVYNVCYRITGNATDALDASQETFGILFRKIGEFRFESKFSSWVYRIAVNASIDIKRRAGSRWVASLDAATDGARSDGPRLEIRDDAVESPPAAAARHELQGQIQHAIDQLSPKMRAITVLRYIESLSYEEIAETLQISIGTVKSRLSRAHAALDRELTPVLDRYYLR